MFEKRGWSLSISISQASNGDDTHDSSDEDVTTNTKLPEELKGYTVIEVLTPRYAV